MVVAELRLDLYASVAPRGSLAVAFGGTRTDRFETGARWTTDGGWTSQYRHTGTDVVTPEPTLPEDVGLTAEAGFRPALRALVYGLAGPMVTLEGGLRAEVGVTDPRCRASGSAPVIRPWARPRSISPGSSTPNTNW